MSQSFQSRANKIGKSPGTLLHIGQQKTDSVIIQLVDYDESGYFLERETDDAAELAAAIESPSITWINVVGLHHIAMIDEIGDVFGIHPLLLEDILNTDQRPKMEHYDQYIYLIVKKLIWHEADGRIEAEQLSIVLGSTFVLTFQEQENSLFNPLRQRLREGSGRLRKSGADYLAYAILDLVVDQYFLILEELGDQVEALEEELITAPNKNSLQSIYKLKRELIFLRKSVWPLREFLAGLQRGDSELFQQTTHIYLRDVYEHAIQILDTVETYREIVVGMMDIYLSSVSNKMNEVMKILTVIATIFIPLTFITSLYGMNFRYMPELQWRWGYFVVWLIILLIGAGMMLYFKRKKWL